MTHKEESETARAFKRLESFFEKCEVYLKGDVPHADKDLFTITQVMEEIQVFRALVDQITETFEKQHEEEKRQQIVNEMLSKSAELKDLQA